MKLAIFPVAWKLGEVFMQHVVKVIICCIQLFDVTGCIKLLHEFCI